MEVFSSLGFWQQCHAHSGEACASLRLCLGIHPCRFVQKSCEVKKSESPARRKKGKKRAAEARIKVKVTTDASNSKRESESAENVNSDPVDSVTSSVCDGVETNTQSIVLIIGMILVVQF